MGGRVGIDDTHLTRSHWKLVLLLLLLLLLLLHSYSLCIYTPPPPSWGYDRTLAVGLAPPPPKNLHSAADVPKKVEKTSSENTTFKNSMRPYRTCGSSGGIFFFLNFPKIDQKPFIPLRTSPKKSKKRQARTRFSKTAIPLRTSPKKSKKRQAKTLLLKIRCARIALAAIGRSRWFLAFLPYV